MSDVTLHPVVRYVRTVAGGRTDQPTDRELLDRFAGGGDQAAFAALVRRHGPAVLATCRRVLRDQADAEDAFQATFLVLARKAGAVHWRSSIGGWLAGVAHRVAGHARLSACR